MSDEKELLQQTIEKKKEDFTRDLQNKDLDERYIVQKYLCNGYSPILSAETIFLIKYEIAKKFNIHPNEIILTGSAQLGFSIAPKKDLRNFNDDSDIDIAIISSSLFERFWYRLIDFNSPILRRTVEEQKKFQKFIFYLFKGWIRPDKFPFDFKGADDWFDFFRTLTIKFHKVGNHKIRAGIYKNFDVFEMYNIQNIKRIRDEIKQEEIKLWIWQRKKLLHMKTIL